MPASLSKGGLYPSAPFFQPAIAVTEGVVFREPIVARRLCLNDGCPGKFERIGGQVVERAGCCVPLIVVIVLGGIRSRSIKLVEKILVPQRAFDFDVPRLDLGT